MNKTGVMLMAIISLILASCDVDWDKLYPESQNPYLDENYFVLTKTLPDNLEIKGNSDKNTMVPLFDFEMMQFLKGDSVAFEMEISDVEEFYHSSKVSTIINGNHVFAKASDLLDLFQREFHIEKPRDMYIRYIAYKRSSNDQNTRIGGYENYFGETTVTVTLTPKEDIIIENNYYLLGTINGWSVAKAVKFDHTGDVFDNPVFTLDVDVSESDAAAGWWWKIIPESTYVTGDWVDADYAQYGPAENGDEATEGMIVPKLNGVEPGAGCITKAGHYFLTIDMKNRTYCFSDGRFIYLVGAPGGWANPTEDNASHYEDWKLYDMDGNGNYTGTFYIPKGEFMFRFYKKLNGWDTGSIGSQAEDAPIDFTWTDGIYQGAAVNGKGNWNDPTWAGGNVKITVNINNGTVLFEKK